MIPNYVSCNPDLILINSHGVKSNEKLKIPGDIVHKINYSDSLSDGSAIAAKYDIENKLYDTFDTDFLAVEIDTNLGPIIISTTYIQDDPIYRIKTCRNFSAILFLPIS